jgi:hypothetical protein
MSDGSRALVEIVQSLGTLLHVLVAIAFIGISIWKAGRIGTAGAWMLIVVTVLDLAALLFFRLSVSFMRSAQASFESIMNAFQMFDAFTSVVSVGLVVAAYATMRAPPALPAP